GVAMQFFYQFPQRVERLALVSSGGLGREVSPLLRTAALPGMSGLLSLTIHPRLLDALYRRGARLRERGLGTGAYLQAVARALRPLENEGSRQAFLQTLRAVIDSRGQRVSATDRLYLLETVPTLIVWGERDNTIPLAHGHAAHRAIPGSAIRTLPRAAHFPNLEDPEGLAEALLEFIAATEPAAPEATADWGAVLAGRTPRSRRAERALA
ncbi:MAG: alpha/beta fold hydrolase, partial [Solirubrobacteraceae bacterium]